MAVEFVDGAQGNLRVVADVAGDAAPLIFIHADAGVLEHWDQTRAHLAGRTTAAFDRRGHGRSDAPANGSFDHRDSAHDVAAVADALGYERFILVGHSGGALTAFAFAALWPERLVALALVDPPPDPKILPPGMLDKQIKAMRENYDPTLEQYYRSIAGDNPSVVERVLNDARATARETVIGATEALRDVRPAEFSGRFKGPTLSIIQPQFDIEGALHRLPPGFPHVIIDGAGHWIHLGAPDRFCAVLDRFLDA